MTGEINDDDHPAFSDGIICPIAISVPNAKNYSQIK